MTKNYDDWNLTKKNTDKLSSVIKIKEGEIRWCRIGLNIGYEIIGKGTTFHRPVIIIKKFNGDVFLGLPLTSKFHTGDWYYHIISNGVNQTVILNQSRILDKKRLEEKICEISESELLNIKRSYCELIMK